MATPTRLHIGCGLAPMRGWTNIDAVRLPGVDRVLDVTRGLPFQDVAFIFGEHFLEHLSLLDGLAFLRHCRRALGLEGVLRMATPSLEYVMQIQYPHARMQADEEFAAACLNTNRAFYAWGHRFLYNKQILEQSLRTAGFAHVTFHRYGESTRAELANLERHERFPDSEAYPHVIIAEAWGRQPELPTPEPYKKFNQDVEDVSALTRLAEFWVRIKTHAARLGRDLRSSSK